MPMSADFQELRSQFRAFGPYTKLSSMFHISSGEKIFFETFFIKPDKLSSPPSYFRE